TTTTKYWICTINGCAAKVHTDLNNGLMKTVGNHSPLPGKEEKKNLRDTDDDIQMSEFALQKNVPLGLDDLGLLATVGPRTTHVYDKLRVVVLSTDSEKILDSNKIMLMRILKDLNTQHAIYFQGGIIDDA
ncbi:unnamed protein product, partial [Rotaria magnacalcarata]